MTKSKPAKFVQIAICEAVGRTEMVALDADGNVWKWVETNRCHPPEPGTVQGWLPMSMARLEPEEGI